MTSRERVRTAIRRQEPDRVPIDFGGMGSTGIMAIAHSKLKEYLGLNARPTRMYDGGQQLAEVEAEILERFHIDVISLGRTYSPVTDPDRTREFEEKWGGSWREWTMQDGSKAHVSDAFQPESDGKGGWKMRNERGGIFAVMPEGALYFDSGPDNNLLRNAQTIEDLADWKPGRTTEESFYGTREKAKWLQENTEYAVMGGFGGGGALEPGQGLRGWGQWMMDLAGDRPFAEEIIGRLVEAGVHNAKLFMEIASEYIDIIVVGDDLGTQAGPQMSPQMYHELIHPAHKAVYQTVHDADSDAQIFLHSCGGIRPLIDDLIDEGVDILNPVQTNAVGMEPRGLKDEFGDALTFWGGGAEVAGPLTTGTPGEVREQVRERIGIFAPGGGYVFNQVHNIQANVPPENIVAMFDAAYEFGAYPVG